MKIIKGILATVGGVFLFLILAGALSGERDYAVQSDYNQPSVFEQSFMKSCVDGDSEFRSYCQCTFDYMIDLKGEEGFKELGRDYLTDGQIPDEMMDAVEECLYLLQ